MLLYSFRHVSCWPAKGIPEGPMRGENITSIFVDAAAEPQKHACTKTSSAMPGEDQLDQSSQLALDQLAQIVSDGASGLRCNE